MEWHLWKEAGSTGGWQWCEVCAREREGETACWSGAGVTAGKRQVPLRIDKAAGEEEEGETEQRGSELPKRTKRTGGGKRQRRNQRSIREGGEQWGQWTKKTPLENGLGRVCGEPVARQWVRRSGSKCLFLSSEFPGSRLAAIPGTGVTFPAEPTKQGEKGRGGGHVHARTAAHAHKQTTHADTHTYARSMCRHAHTLICTFILFSIRLTNLMFSHTHSHLR